MDLIFAIFGLIIGSFLNVVIARYNTGLKVNGRSKCLSCNKTLTPLELVPVFSFLFQNGKCKKCGSKISNQYILVELLTALLFYLVVHIFGIGIQSFLYLIAISILMVISVYDIKHKIIPDLAVYIFIAVSLLTNIYLFGTNLFSADFLAGPVLFALFALVWLASEGRWMGFGDAKLVLGLGFLLGFNNSVFATLLAFWTGAVVGILLLALSRGSITIEYEVPFAPFLVFGSLVALFTSFNILYYLAISL